MYPGRQGEYIYPGGGTYHGGWVVCASGSLLPWEDREDIRLRTLLTMEDIRDIPDILGFISGKRVKSQLSDGPENSFKHRSLAA